MQVATELFADLGFENTSIAKICEEAMVSKGLVYHHFKNKNALLREIFASTTARMVEISSGKAAADPRKQLANIIRQLFTQLKSDKQFFQLNLNIMLQPSTRSVLSDLIDERAQHLLQTVKLLFNTIDPENSEVKSYVFIAELDGIALNYLSVFEDYPLEEIKNHLINKYGDEDNL